MASACAARRRPSPRNARSRRAPSPTSIAGSPASCRPPRGELPARSTRRKTPPMEATNPDGEYRDGALAARWRRTVVLKHDPFSTVERGYFRTPDGEVDAVLRRIDRVPWWSRPVARHFLKREARALAVAGAIRVAPELLHAGPDALVRRFIDGVALHIARPLGDRGYFRSARAALAALHRAGICHNDLAKEQNWLRGTDGRAYLTDFQLAVRFRRRSRLFRIAAYEDLRHLLKHKRSYAPEALT